MQVVNELTKKKMRKDDSIEVMIDHIPGMIIKGYVHHKTPVVNVLVFSPSTRSTSVELGVYELLKDKLIYSSRRGIYISIIDYPEDDLLQEKFIKGQGKFPYSFDRKYEAIENFRRFNGKQVIEKEETFKVAKYIKYSFGLEFETSMGYIPEEKCYRDGLIPLRDGSISGLEYSSVVLQGNKGLCLLKQQLKTLREYTFFNKECSLHIHFGGFNLTPEFIFSVYAVCESIEGSLRNILPPLTFKSSEYKENEKDYCQFLPRFRNFNEMYEYLVGRKFFGDLTQPHPNDVRREAKWRIPTRQKNNSEANWRQLEK